MRFTTRSDRRRALSRQAAWYFSYVLIGDLPERDGRQPLTLCLSADQHTTIINLL